MKLVEPWQWMMALTSLAPVSRTMVLMAWGLRFVLHRGGERALSRVVFAVIGVALASVYAATLVPGTAWPHSFGLGGLFGVEESLG